jgi:histidinol-phosphate phosphatase family protein
MLLDSPDTSPVTLLRGPAHVPILGSSPAEQLRQVELSGIAPPRLARFGEGDVSVLLPEASWWERNIGALVAHQRAIPEHAVFLLEGAGMAQNRTGIVALPGGGLPPALRVAPHRALSFEASVRIEAVLLDRDGTLIADRPYLADAADVTLLPGVAEGLRRLEASGIRRIVVTNQSGVARGAITPEALTRVHDRLRALLGSQGASVDAIFACPHREEDECGCRKPKAGLARAAACELHLDLGRVVVAGDKPVDLGLARTLGVPAFLVMTGSGPATLAQDGLRPDFVVDGLDEFARVVTHPAGIGHPVTAHRS